VLRIPVQNNVVRKGRISFDGFTVAADSRRVSSSVSSALPVSWFFSSFLTFGQSAFQVYPIARGGVSEVLCSDHPNLLNRVNTTAAQAYSVQSGPPQHLFKFPADATRERYRQFQSWYPQRVEQIQRIAAGNLTPSEASTTRQVEIEVKPRSASATLDGQAISSGKSKIHLGLGPHLLAASAGDKQQEYRFVVLDQGPDKFKLEIK
jgi:hypothetical protein